MITITLENLNLEELVAELENTSQEFFGGDENSTLVTSMVTHGAAW